MHHLRPVSVDMRKRPIENPWVDFVWEVVGVVEAEGAIDADSDNPLPEGVQRYGGLIVDLHPSEGEGYWLNLTSPEPSYFVMWRQEDVAPAVPWVVTLSYNEAGRMLDAGEKVDRVPLPESMRAWAQAFTDLHYKPEVRKKQKRNADYSDSRRFATKGSA